MRKYETIVVFSPELGEAAIKDEIKKVENLLTSNQGEEVKVNIWGKKDIAYTVARQKLGYFVLITFSSANHAIVENLARILSITETVVKFQTHRINEKVRKFKGNPKRKSSTEGEDDFSFGADAEY